MLGFRTMPERFLIIDTSHRKGAVALAQGERVLAQRRLEESRRHARDLVPAARALLREHDCTARDLTGVVVSLGPGSYTGLRVGLISAKTLAYATGCVLLGVDTFTACAHQAAVDAQVVDVLADAQQGKIYVRRFTHGQGGKLEIKPWTSWLEDLPLECWATGPGLEIIGDKLPGKVRQTPQEDWLIRPETLLTLGLERFRRGEKDDPFILEPIYLRPSAAEEKYRGPSPSANGG
jgi:tRNA threonylcarbamoyladenosine biosynthesis protein TsaB